MKRVVVIGGGYAGIKLIRELISELGELEIILIDKHPYHHLQPEIYDFIANKSTIADVTIDLFTLCKGLSEKIIFKNLRVESIDFAKKEIFTEEKEVVNYDYLVFAIGSRTAFPKTIEGLDKANDIKKIHKALYFKQSFEQSIQDKIAFEGKKCEETHIVVVGAGLSGVEIAGEMAYYANNFFKRGHFACDNMKIYLISSRDRVLPGLDDYLGDVSRERLEELGVNIIYNSHMTKADKDFIYLSNGNSIRYSFVVFAGGIEGSNLTNRLDLPKNKKGQLIVNSFLQVSGYENVFAIGDVAEIKNSAGSVAPANVTIAVKSASVCAKNIISHIKNSPLSEFVPKIEGVLVALGGRYAVGLLYDKIKVKGIFAYMIKHFVFIRYKLPLLKYLKIGYSKIHKR